MEYVKTLLKLLLFIPFLTSLILFTGFSALITVVDRMDMPGKSWAKAILGIGAFVGIGGSRLFGKIYE